MDDIHLTLKNLEAKIESALQNQKLQRAFEKESDTRFKKNLVAFEKYFPALCKEIKNFEPRDDFRVFAAKSGAGNFIPKDSPVPLYGDEPIAQCEAQVERYTQSAVFGRSELYKEVPKGAGIDDRLHFGYMVELAQTFVNADLRNERKLSALPTHYPTCMMFGLGLGYPLATIMQQFSFDYVFVCEPDFEVFYASLFCIDWEKIFLESDAKSGCLFLKVGISYDTFFDELNSVVHSVGNSSLISSFCYQHTPGAEINSLIKRFFDNFSLLQAGYGFYNDAITGLAHALENFNDNKCPAFLPNRNCTEKLRSLTAYVVANGPSLDEAIDVIRDNQHQVVIFAAGTALNSLLKLGVTPDFHVLVERPKTTYDYLLHTLNPDVLGKINLLSVDVMYPEVPLLYNWSGLALKGPEASSLLCQYDYFTKYKEVLPALPHPGPLVANTALSFAASLGFGEVYMFGVDNGYPTSGKTHSEHSIYNERNRHAAFNVDTKGAVYELDGNFEGTVKATSLMAQAHQHIESLIKVAPNTQFYNVGSGAKIKRAIPLKSEDVLRTPKVFEKEDVVEEIKSQFFQKFEISEPSKSVGLDEFESLCDYLIEIGNRPYKSRKEASDLLKAQSRVVFAYKGRKFGHLYHVMKGSMMYFHCPLISLLYLYNNEEKTLNTFAKAMDVWNRYILAMKADFRNSWQKRCDHSLEKAVMLKDSN
ncbi:motility associated factor glycosyltransferase family protein [Alteromonas mediterranea]|uniref:motility associated factor glycosyltransferase family protein n=1 Tax=Alteromonas mediterranea TaxID=314275 RepID=UPI002FDFC1DE